MEMTANSDILMGYPELLWLQGAWRPRVAVPSLLPCPEPYCPTEFSLEITGYPTLRTGNIRGPGFSRQLGRELFTSSTSLRLMGPPCFPHSHNESIRRDAFWSPEL